MTEKAMGGVLFEKSGEGRASLKCLVLLFSRRRRFGTDLLAGLICCPES
jgi:hypothetical protein